MSVRMTSRAWGGQHGGVPQGGKLLHGDESVACSDAGSGSRQIENSFRVIKWQFGYTKVRFRGLVKNTAQLVTLFVLSNLWIARRHLLANAG